jgi:CDP-diacylglycerol--glycerol-3-phosphate 3-phosphatidyltransferase
MSLTDQRQPQAKPEGGPAPGAPLNLPNCLTLARVALALLLFALIDRGTQWLAAFFVFGIAAATDAIDGWLARRYGQITVLGRILDPFADKVIIGGAFVFLAAQPDSGVGPWMAIIVIGREMFVTSLRSFLEREGKDFSATLSGKIKMVVQCAAVGLALLYLEYGGSASRRADFERARDILLWVAVAVTLHSGYVYAVRAINLFRRG